MEICIKKLSADISSNVCILTKNIFNSLRLSTEIPYTVHFGQSSKETFLSFLNVTENNMYFSKKIFDDLKLLQNLKLSIRKINNDLFIGPSVGILVTANYMKRALKNLPPSLTQHLSAGISEQCLAYFFSADCVDLSENKIKGITFIPELNKYDYCYLPLPDVVYERCVNFSKGEMRAVRILKRKLKNNFNIKLINNVNSLGKWEVCDGLSKYPEIKKYLPETILYSSFDDVINMLNRNEFIFIKSCYGSRGKEVLSIERPNNSYRLNYYEKGLKEIYLSSITDVQEVVTSFIGNKKFIIQQGIHLLTFEGRCMDLRILSMKNEYGKWESIFKAARIAKGNLLITNTSAGGDCAIYEQIYEKLKAEHRSIDVPSSEKLDEAAALLASYIEKELGSLGEIGLDIGIDTDGSIWIIEANATPDKVLSSSLLDINGNSLSDLISQFYTGRNEDKKIMSQALGIFKYAKFLSKFTQIN